MPDFDDVELAKPKEPQPPKKGYWPLLVLLLVLALAGLGAWYLLARKKSAPPVAPPPVAETPAPAPEAPAAEQEPAIELPSLDESDDLVRQLVSELSSHPDLAAYLTPAGLVRRFTVVVDNIAEGVNPRKHLAELTPQGSFAAEKRGGETYVDPASWKRYDTFADLFTSLDTQGTVRLYRNLKPLIQQAYRDLGYPRADFDSTLLRAIQRLLSTPVPTEPVRLRPKGLVYAYADPRFESLSPAQRAFLRMGPTNVRRVQAKLRELALALGFSPDELPSAPG